MLRDSGTAGRSSFNCTASADGIPTTRIQIERPARSLEFTGYGLLPASFDAARGEARVLWLRLTRRSSDSASPPAIFRWPGRACVQFAGSEREPAGLRPGISERRLRGQCPCCQTSDDYRASLAQTKHNPRRIADLPALPVSSPWPKRQDATVTRKAQRATGKKAASDAPTRTRTSTGAATRHAAIILIKITIPHGLAHVKREIFSVNHTILLQSQFPRFIENSSSK